MCTEFKAGESVYQFNVIKGVTVEVLEDIRNESEIYSLQCDGNTYTKYGYLHYRAKIPSLYKLTEENYNRLCAFVGKYAVPKLPSSPNEIMIELLKGGGHSAFVSIHSHETARIHRSLTLIVGYEDGFFWSQDDAKWDYVIPCDSRGNEITELGGDDE